MLSVSTSPTLSDFLRGMCEQVPAWLENYKSGDAFGREQLFASRVVYYPGSATDGQPVRLFGSTHNAHMFVYVDYGLAQSCLEAELAHPTHRFRGYHTLARINLAEADLAPHGWVPHVKPSEVAPNWRMFATAPPFGFLEVLERDDELDDKHGASRLAILFLGADGFAAYDALFCQQSTAIQQPFAIIVQDHGFGGGYDQFGRGGLLERIARRCKTSPPWILVAENTEPWSGYDRVTGLNGDIGGMHSMQRYLYKRRD